MTLTTYAKPIRDIPVDEIKTADILTVLKPLWIKSPAMAAKFRGRLEKVSTRRGRSATSRGQGQRRSLERTSGPPLSKRQRLIKGHHRAMAYADLPAFMDALERDPRRVKGADVHHPDLRTNLGSAAGDMGRNRSPTRLARSASRMKMGKPHDVPLSDAALRLFGDQTAGAAKTRSCSPAPAPAAVVDDDGHAAAAHGRST